jgi:hypothetical protein
MLKEEKLHWKKIMTNLWNFVANWLKRKKTVVQLITVWRVCTTTKKIGKRLNSMSMQP